MHTITSTITKTSKKQFSCYGKNSTEPDVCSGKGICSSYNNCTCNEGYRGDYCQNTICFQYDSSDKEVCSGNGNCTTPNQCDCQPKYVGIDCKYPVCFGLNSSVPNSCGLKGKCVEPDVCECVLGYAGFVCEFTECHGINSTNLTFVCSNQGNCTDYNICSCDSKFYGRICQFRIPTNPLLWGFGVAVGISLSIIVGFILFTPFIFLFQAILKKIKNSKEHQKQEMDEKEKLVPTQ